MEIFKTVSMTINNEDVVNKATFEMYQEIKQALETTCNEQTQVNLIKIDVFATDVSKLIELTNAITKIKNERQFDFLVCFYKGKSKKCYQTL